MISQNSYLRKLAKEDVKQSKYLIIIHTIALLLLSSLPALILLNSYTHQSAFSDVNYLLSDIYSELSLSSAFTIFVVCILGTIIGTSNFSYLFSTKSTIFYHSMPHKRETIYLSKVISGIITIFIPLLITFFVNLCIYLSCNLFGELSILAFINSYLFVFLMYVFVFAISVLAATLSSNVFAQYIVLGFIYLVYPITALVAMGFVQTFTETFSLVPILFDSPEYMFPPLQLVSNIAKYRFTDMSIHIFEFDYKLIIYTIIILIVAIICGMFIYKKRKTENTNKFVSFNWCTVFLKYYMTTIASISCALVFYAISFESLFGGLVGLVLGAFIVFCTLQAIFDKSLKNMFSNIKSFAILAIVLCIAVFAQVKLANVFDDKFPSNASEISMSINSDSRATTDVLLQTPENVENATALLKKAAISSYKNDYEIYSNNISASTPLYDFFGIKRDFDYVEEKDVQEFLEKSYDTDEYKNQISDIKNDSTLGGIINEKIKYFDKFNFEKNNQYTPEIIKTLKNDILKYSYNDIKNSDLEFVLFFDVNYSNSNYKTRIYQKEIYSCYEDTLNAMKKYGFITNNGPVITKMAFLDYTKEGDGYYNNFGVDDKELVDLMLNMNTKNLSNSSRYITIRFYSKDDVLVYTKEYSIEDLPQKVQSYIKDNNIPYLGNEKGNIDEPLAETIEVK